MITIITSELARYAGRIVVGVAGLAFVSAVMIMLVAVMGKVREKWRKL